MNSNFNTNYNRFFNQEKNPLYIHEKLTSLNKEDLKDLRQISKDFKDISHENLQNLSNDLPHKISSRLTKIPGVQMLVDRLRPRQAKLQTLQEARSLLNITEMKRASL